MRTRQDIDKSRLIRLERTSPTQFSATITYRFRSVPETECSFSRDCKSLYHAQVSSEAARRLRPEGAAPIQPWAAPHKR